MDGNFRPTEEAELKTETDSRNQVTKSSLKVGSLDLSGRVLDTMIRTQALGV